MVFSLARGQPLLQQLPMLATSKRFLLLPPLLPRV